MIKWFHKIILHEIWDLVGPILRSCRSSAWYLLATTRSYFVQKVTRTWSIVCWSQAHETSIRSNIIWVLKWGSLTWMVAYESFDKLVYCRQLLSPFCLQSCHIVSYSIVPGFSRHNFTPVSDQVILQVMVLRWDVQSELLSSLQDSDEARTALSAPLPLISPLFSLSVAMQHAVLTWAVRGWAR